MSTTSTLRQYVRKATLPCQVLDDELIVLDGEHDTFFSSNAVGAHIWEQLESPRSIDALTASILEAFDGADAPTVEADTSELLKAMLEKNLIEVVDGSQTPS